MTFQTPDLLVVRGEVLDLFATPLDGYLRRLPKSRRPTFALSSTACHRGYVARWVIRDGWLWLDGFAEGLLDAGPSSEAPDSDRNLVEATLETAFPWLRLPVRATWVTGWLRAPEGRVVHYVHMGFDSCYERDRWFELDRGRVEAERLVVNPSPSSAYDVDPQTGIASPAEHRLVLSPPPSPAPGLPLEGPAHWRAAADALEAEDSARIARAESAERLQRMLGRPLTIGDLTPQGD
jgi:hypothetical protein